MYINGAILHSFVYLAILLVRIQLLSVAPVLRRHEGPPPLQPPRTMPASDLTSFRRRHYRARPRRPVPSGGERALRLEIYQSQKSVIMSN